MAQSLHSCLAVVLFVAPFAVVLWPRSRRVLGVLMVVVAAGCIANGVALRGAVARLEVTHTFTAYEGSRIVPKDFNVDEVEAAAWQWPALCAAWLLAWGLWSVGRPRAGDPAHPFGLPLLLAWGGSALVLALQKVAAPAPLALGPWLAGFPPVELAALPATIAAAALLGLRAEKAWHPFLYLSLVIALVRLPLATFGTLATRNEWGTSLDVHRIAFVANPLTRMPTELAPGSAEQLTTIVWFPQLILWPALSLLSGGGVAFAVFMVRRAAR